MQRATGITALLLLVAAFAPTIAALLTAAVPTLASILVLLVALRVIWNWLT
jgi:hypothetical protein